MDERGDRRPFVSSPMARYMYPPSGHTSLPHTVYDPPSLPPNPHSPSLSLPRTEVSASAMNFSRYRAGQAGLGDVGDPGLSPAFGAHSTGSGRNMVHGGDQFPDTKDSMHSPLPPDLVENMYRYANYSHPARNAFSMEGAGSQVGLFASQLGLHSKLPSSPLFTGMTPDTCSQRNAGSLAPSPQPSAMERTLLKSEAYNSMSSKSSYADFSPRDVNTLSGSDLPLPVSLPVSLGSALSFPASSYSPSPSVSHMETCFPTSAASAYSYGVRGQERNQYPESDSPKMNSSIHNAIDLHRPHKQEGSKRKSRDVSVDKIETHSASTQSSPFYPSALQNHLEKKMQEKGVGVMNADYRHLSTATSMTPPLVRNKSQSGAGEVKYTADSFDSYRSNLVQDSDKPLPPFSLAGSHVTSQHSSPSVPAGSSHSHAMQSSPIALDISDSSDTEPEQGNAASSQGQKNLVSTNNTKPFVTDSFSEEKPVQWKKKQLLPPKSSLPTKVEKPYAYQSPQQKYKQHLDKETTTTWQTSTTVIDECKDEAGLDKPPNVKLVIKKKRTIKEPYKTAIPKEPKSSASTKMKQSPKELDSNTCPVCLQIFSESDGESLAAHMRIHRGDKPYHCQECESSYKTAGQLRDHVNSKHAKERPYVCSKCGKDFSYSTARRRHEKVCGLDLATRIEFQCPTCDKGFVTAKGFSKHLQTCSHTASDCNTVSVDGDQIMTQICQACDKTFPTLPSLDRHQRFFCGRVPQKGTYTCEECGKVFQSRNRYITHTRRHTGDKAFSCSQCNLSFYDRLSLRTHRERYHENSGKFKCSLCVKAFFDFRSLNKHMIRQHTWKSFQPSKKTVKRYTCRVCGLSMAWIKVRRHVSREHPGMKVHAVITKDMFKCDVCKKEFLSEQVLRVHKRGHNISKCLKCEECRMPFAVKSALECHYRKHGQKSGRGRGRPSSQRGMKPGLYKRHHCQFCDSSYRTTGMLRDHVLSKHSTSRPYLCAKCGKDFAYSTAKRRHEKFCGVDLSERIQFQCQNCDKGFVTVKGFTKHQETCAYKLGERVNTENGANLPFKCPNCDKAFASFPSLDRHQRFICGRTPQKGVYACEECGKVFTKRDRYITHTRRHTGEKPFQCSHCELCFYDQITLKTHFEKWHQVGGKYTCAVCKQHFMDQETWKCHMHEHSVKVTTTPGLPDITTLTGDNVKQYMCMICNQSFIWRNLCVHVAAEHPGVTLTQALNKELLQCDACPKEFPCPESLKLHKKKHVKEKRFKCDKCNLQFAFKSSLLTHIRVHDMTTDRPHCCEDCGKTFCWSQSLKQHRQVAHRPKTGKDDKTSKMFACNDCSKRFKTEKSLYLHLKLKQHGNRQDKPYVCSQCGIGFISMSEYTVHVSMHGAQSPSQTSKPFTCLYCGMGFQYVSLRDRHVKMAHDPSRPALGSDTDSGKPFTSKDAWTEHAKMLDKYALGPMPGMDMFAGVSQPAFPKIERQQGNEAYHGMRDSMGHAGQDHSHMEHFDHTRPGLKDQGLPALDGRLPTQDGRLSTQDDRLPTQDDRLPTQDGRLSTQDGRLSTQDGRLPTQDGRLPTQDGRLSSQDGRLSAQDRRLSTQDGRLPTQDGRQDGRLPNFSTFEDQHYRSHFSTYIHQTLGWPKPGEHTT